MSKRLSARERKPRAELLTALRRAIRRVSAQSVLLSQTIASRANISSTDMECLDLLAIEGPTTPGRLATRIGLTTGAVTMLIDRLERGGFVRRTPNPADRRSVIVEALPTGVQVLMPMFEPLARGMAKLNERYSAAELALVLDYLTRAYEVGWEHLRWLERSAPAPGNRPLKGRTFVGLGKGDRA
ncbi:MAG: MarR family winged helix-turn-helix transcriptional regulator [Vicinamibacteria bacterium]